MSTLASTPILVSIRVDAARKLGPLKPIYRFFGADEPNYAYMKDGQKLLTELGQLSGSAITSGSSSVSGSAPASPNQVYFRTHNLLVTGDGTPALKWGSTNAYTEDSSGNAVYDWTIIDRIFETYLERGVKPYVQIGFMPQVLSTADPERVPYQHSWTPTARYEEIYTGWAYPPRDHAKWGELVYQWVGHCVDKYGRAEVESWYWETWNEPNIGYWQGTPEEFYALHDHAIEAVRRALPTARVGGPETAGGGTRYLHDFLEHCLHEKNAVTGKMGSPLDFVSFHAKGAPEYLSKEKHVRMGISNQLREIDGAFETIAGFPELKDTPIVIGESDPEGCAAAQGPELGYRNSTMYSSYTAASFVRKHDLAAKHGVNLEGALTWAFEFEDQPYFAGFRVLASNGIDLPVMNVFRMFAKMGGTRVEAQSSAQVELGKILEDGVRTGADIGALASLDGSKLCILVWHYHDDDVAGPVAHVKLDLGGFDWSGDAQVDHFRIDDKHSNAYAAWQAMGSPQQPTPEQYSALETAGQLSTVEDRRVIHIEGGQVTLSFHLPRQGVSLLVLER